MATKANMGKFTDYIEKYDGENPSEYAQFKRDFEQTLTMLDSPQGRAEIEAGCE